MGCVFGWQRLFWPQNTPTTAWLTLALTLPDVDEAWLESFSDSLFDLLNYYDMQLIGGDTTRGPLSMTLGIHGFVPMGRALTRSGAKPGDWIYVTGTPGDSAAGLAILPLLSQGSGSSSGTATPLLLETVLATFIGAAFSRRRVVTIWGALLGAILVNALSNGLGRLGVNIVWMGAIKGGLILVVLAASAVRHIGGEA